MIQQKFGISNHLAHCSRLLSSLNCSQQKSVQKASQRDEAAIQTWKDQRIAQRVRPSVIVTAN